MHSVVILGAGKIGRMIARFLHQSGAYDVLAADVDAGLLSRLQQQTPVKTALCDASNPAALREVLRGRQSVISALSYSYNPGVAEAALETGTSYFDLTEDVATTRRVRELASQSAGPQIFMPQCGLAPGFVSIAAAHLARQFEQLDMVHLRVGALPQFPSNALKYNLTWSTDGLINEYCNLCETIHDGKPLEELPLEGLEQFSLDGVRYEAFNTSGGLGTLCETLKGKVRELNYKTIRYLGHRDLMSFLVNDLRLKERRDILKDVLEFAVPVTFQDVVVIFVTAMGKSKGQFVQKSDARKIYSREIDGEHWSAIQITTAAGICTALDLHRLGKLPKNGFVRQEEIALPDFLASRFGRYYESTSATRFSRTDGDEVKAPQQSELDFPRP